jgi:DHA1 family tetracycline resistance protein-like MFS transporter
MSDPSSIQTELPPAPSPSGTTPRKAMTIVFSVVFIDLLGFALVLPLLPLYGERYVAPLIEGGHKSVLGGTVIGLLMSSFSAMQFIFAPIWGRVSDRIGRRPILLIGLAGSVAFYALFGYASDLPRDAENAKIALALLFIARIGAGIAGATIATAQAVIADCTPPERRKHGMALIGAAFGIGFTFGPLIGAGASAAAPEWLGLTGFIASGLSAAALGIAIAIMPETRRFGEVSGARRRWFDTQAIRAALSNPAVAPVVWTFFLATLGFASFEVTLSPLNNNVMRLPDKFNFLVFAYVGFVLVMTQGFLYRRLANKLTEPTFMAAGIGLMGSGLICLLGVTLVASQYGGDDTLPGWLFGCLFLSLTLAVIGFAFLTPSAQALVSRRSDPERQGEVLGVNQSASSMARILGPMIGMTLFGAEQRHVLPYLFGAVLLLAMLPLIPRIRRGGAETATA